MEIVGRQVLRDSLRIFPKKYTVVAILEPYDSIWYPDEKCDEIIEEIQENAKEIKIERFWDVWNKNVDDAPTYEQVKSILDWAKGKDIDFVSCRAGVSRSTAIGILIKCQEIFAGQNVSIEDAIRELRLIKGFHKPNLLILGLGEQILNIGHLMDKSRYILNY